MSWLLILLLACQLALPGEECGVEEYLDKLRTAVERTSWAAQNPAGREAAASALLKLEALNVRLGDNETVPVRNDWVDTAIEELREDDTGEAARRILTKLRAIEKEVTQVSGGKTTAARAELAGGEEFGDTVEKPDIDDVDLGIKESLRSVAEWLREKLRREPDSRRTEAVSISLPRAIVWILAVAIVGLLVFFMIRHIMRSGVLGRPEFSGGPRVRSLLDDALKRTPEQWKELARQYCDKGDFTQALRALYLGLLVILHRRRLISYETSRTNWEYVWELGTAKPEHGPFAELTRAFDYKWYGRESCTRQDYLALEGRADSIIAVPAQGEANER